MRIGVLWAGLRVAMWITHVGGKFRHGLLEKSLNYEHSVLTNWGFYAGNAKRSTTTAPQQNGALGPQVHGRYPNPGNTQENRIYHNRRGITRNLGTTVVVDSQSTSLLFPRVCQWWFPNGGSSSLGERNSATPFLPQFNLLFTSLLPLFNLVLPLFNLNLTSASSRISNHGLETTAYRFLVFFRDGPYFFKGNAPYASWMAL